MVSETVFALDRNAFLNVFDIFTKCVPNAKKGMEYFFIVLKRTKSVTPKIMPLLHSILRGGKCCRKHPFF
jgi:hypothetical protein